MCYFGWTDDGIVTPLGEEFLSALGHFRRRQIKGKNGELRLGNPFRPDEAKTVAVFDPNKCEITFKA